MSAFGLLKKICIILGICYNMGIYTKEDPKSVRALGAFFITLFFKICLYICYIIKVLRTKLFVQ